jgi:CheY-like chemotaxis protein/two-component sensor histidine kinase
MAMCWRATWNGSFMTSPDVDELTRASRAIAHDLRNVFSVITACAIDLQAEMQGRQAAALVLEIINAGERGLLAATELLHAGQVEASAVRPMDLVRQVQELRPLLYRLAAPELDLELETSVSAAWVAIDRTSLLQILMNLVANASDASSPGAPVRVIVSRTRRAGEPDRGTDVASLLVSDEGAGVEAHLLERLFDEGFSTKAGSHWGLGLGVVRRVVERCGGWIDIRSIPGRGTTVEVQFPLAEPVRTGVALVVVRDDHGRRWLADALEATGHTLVVAADALEACDLLEHGVVPDVALLDPSASSDRGLRSMARLDQVPRVIMLRADEPVSVDAANDIVQRYAAEMSERRVSR